jgi:RHS repeat-associated protein
LKHSVGEVIKFLRILRNRTFTWNGENQPTQMSVTGAGVGTHTEQYTYDADNARIKRTRNNVATYYYGGLMEVEKAGTGTSSVTRYYYQFAEGVAAQREVVSSGLRGEYFDNQDLTGHKLTKFDSQVDFAWSDGQSPDPTIGADSFSVRWSGKVRAVKTGTHEFYTYSDDGVRLWVNGQLLIDNWTDHGPTQDMGSISLTEGQDYPITLEYYEGGVGATIQLKWTTPVMDTPMVIPSSQLFPPSTDSVIYLHGDHLGSVSAASDAGGARISQQEYDPWGKLRPVAGSATTTQQSKQNYTGQKLDDTGLLFYNARFYDPGLGRFTSPDSIVPGASFGAGGALGIVGQEQNSKLTVDFHERGFLFSVKAENTLTLQKGFWFQLNNEDRNGVQNPWGPLNPQALNRYSYVLNNPLRYTDPTGHFLMELMWMGPISIGLRVAFSADDLRVLADIIDQGSAPAAQEKAERELLKRFPGLTKAGAYAVVQALTIATAAFLRWVADNNMHLEFFFFFGVVPFWFVAEGREPPKNWWDAKWPKSGGNCANIPESSKDVIPSCRYVRPEDRGEWDCSNPKNYGNPACSGP